MNEFTRPMGSIVLVFCLRGIIFYIHVNFVISSIMFSMAYSLFTFIFLALVRRSRFFCVRPRSLTSKYFAFILLNIYRLINIC